MQSCTTGGVRRVGMCMLHGSEGSAGRTGKADGRWGHGMPHATAKHTATALARTPHICLPAPAAAAQVPGVHDPLDPEFTILKQRLARRVRYEKLDPARMDLPALTHVAERTITDDLEYLIEKAVDPSVADYAVISGVQIHNWGKELSEDGDTSIEFVGPAKCYTVVNGLKTYIDLPQVPVSGGSGGLAGPACMFMCAVRGVA
jgi:hypothetical protein